VTNSTAIRLNVQIARLHVGEDILHLCNKFECELDAINIATAIHRLAKISVPFSDVQSPTLD
jgi:hypothetical protein